MKITDIEVTRHTIALEPPFCPSWDSRPADKFHARQGWLDLGQEPGLGIRYDEQLLEKTRVA